MPDADLILKFEIVEGRSPDAQIAAEALAAWVDVLRAAATAIDPAAAVRIELVGVEKGSQLFKFALRMVENLGSDVQDGMAQYPLINKAVVTLGGLIGSTLIIAGVTQMVTPDPRIPDDQMATFEETRDLLRESVELQKQQMRFYGALQSEPAYDRVDVLNEDNDLIYSIPREEFAPRSGLWDQQTEEMKPSVEPRTATWDVVLIKPVLISSPRRWRFAREGLEFSALMEDHLILEAIHNRTLPMQVAEGVMMKVQIDYKEFFDGKVWIPVPGSHKIKRVLHPLPPVAPSPLFPASAPQKDDKA